MVNLTGRKLSADGREVVRSCDLIAPQLWKQAYRK